MTPNKGEMTYMGECFWLTIYEKYENNYKHIKLSNSCGRDNDVEIINVGRSNCLVKVKIVWA